MKYLIANLREREEYEAADALERLHNENTAYEVTADNLKMEVAAAQADASRYKWLRNNPWFLGWDTDLRPDEIAKEIDKAVDDEMRKSEKEANHG